MKDYDVEVLVHLNITTTVRAADEDAALKLAGGMLRDQYPAAALVDPVNVREAGDAVDEAIATHHGPWCDRSPSQACEACLDGAFEGAFGGGPC
jgi:hypothetical protein